MSNMIEQWAEAIKLHEGFYPPSEKHPDGSASWRNRNPGNFRCSSLVMGEFGATKCVNNLAVFPTYEKGFESLKQFLIYACTDQLRSYKSTMTLLEFYGKYAPSSDGNSPKNYASAVAKDLGVSINTKISELYSEEQGTPEQNSITKYSQNDPQWKDIKMGISNYNLGRWGCTTSSVAILGSWFGDILTPKDYALFKKLYTASGLIIWKEIENISKKIKFKWRNYRFDEKMIDDYLIIKPDTAVTLNVDRGYHWVAALSKVSGGYRCVDPYTFPAKIRVYANNEIEGFAVLIKK
jgi:hypothetical protein